MEILYYGKIFLWMELFVFLDYHFELIKAVQSKVLNCVDLWILEQKCLYYTYMYEQVLRLPTFVIGAKYDIVHEKITTQGFYMIPNILMQQQC